MPLIKERWIQYNYETLPNLNRYFQVITSNLVIPQVLLVFGLHLPCLVAEAAAFPNTWDSHECYEAGGLTENQA